MILTVLLSDITFFGRHGAFHGEQDHPQAFKIDLAFEYETKAHETDDLADAVNYATVRDLIRAYIETEQKRLLESMANDLAKKILKKFPVIVSVTLTITKPFAGSFDGNGAPSVRVTIRRSPCFQKSSVLT